MDAIVLAGGFGTRLRSVVSHVPKPMAPVGDRPFLVLLLESLKSKGITRVILSVGYMSDAIISYFQRHPLGIELVFEVESSPLGTGGAIAAALRHAHSDSVLVINGDTYLDLDLEALRSMWPGDRTPIVVARAVADTERFGRLDVTKGRITRFVGSGIKSAGIINAGCYLIPANVFAGENVPEKFSFEQDFLSKRPPFSLRVFVALGQFIDIGVPDDYARAQTELMGVHSSGT
jgi:D-glycero-alpha-D-manno-heptose 1-phosphate guanylyltransferase